MADGAVNFLLEKLTTFLLQKASLLGDAHDDIEEIKLELESMRSFLRDAERRKEMSESVETWVRQVREVAYEVEDIVDEFMHHSHKARHKNGLKGVVQDVVSFPKKVTARHRISSSLKKIKAKVHEVSERSKRYGFDQLDEGKGINCLAAAAADRWQCHGEPSSFDDEDEIVGMEENTEQLLARLTGDEPRRLVVSIVGMGGLGKTTLATTVYNNPAIKKHFDCRVWISVSELYGFDNLLRAMIKELYRTTQVQAPSNLGSMNYRQLLGMLVDFLHQKRYVIVLDDVWNIDMWSRIRGAFPNNKCGSRIILTTRNENVPASVGIGSHIHRLEPLQEKDAWALFCRKAFWSDPDRCCPKELEPLAKAILKKCEGLPLAIVALGGLMCSRSKTIGEWKKVYESLNWQLSNNPLLEQMKGIMLLSFRDLPFYLRHCFLYCCVFRDGYPINRKKLIRLWVAEGFIIDRNGMTAEEVAEEYLTELILRSMIQVTETNDAGRVKLCRVHDVMRELATTMSQKENFCTAYDVSQSRLQGKFHRLSVYNTGENIRLSSSMSHHPRSFFVFPTDLCSTFSLNTILSKFRLLRVLNLEGVAVETIPGTLIELFNLRYLNLKDTRIKELPKAMARLINLQTLDVRNTNVERLPSGISKLSALRHLCIWRKFDQIAETTNVHGSSMQVPAGIGNIRSLQTLTCVEAHKELILQLGNLTDLKRLDIANLKASDGPKFCASVERMTGLLRLGVMATTAEEELQLGALSTPPLFLQKLTLVGKLSMLPPWVGSLSSLTHLQLRSSCIRGDILSSLHSLSSLLVLELNRAYDGRVLNFKAGWFPRLIKLKLEELAQLDTMELEKGSLPCIKELYQIRCPQLKALPWGIEHLAGLQKLHLEEMADEIVQSARSEDRRKVMHIPNIEIICLTGGTRVLETLLSPEGFHFNSPSEIIS